MLTYHCRQCGKYWSYPVKKCIFCKEDTHAVSETKYTVIGFTTINVPSPGNEKVPYIDYLLEDRNGNKIIMKSFSEYPIGYAIDMAEKKMQAVYSRRRRDRDTGLRHRRIPAAQQLRGHAEDTVARLGRQGHCHAEQETGEGPPGRAGEGAAQ